ncbi:hypothetical protein HIM_01150 [Hirsutella minnesotensis 3608]|nr:hypothetical protein HIM_01150 [Hirsutella minnesotensis 3608]
MKNAQESGTSAPPPIPRGETIAPENTEIIHNHYYTAPLKPIPWYRRRKCLVWSSISILVFVVVSLATVLGVVLKLELGRNRAVRAHQNQADISSPQRTYSGGSPVKTVPPMIVGTATTNSGPSHFSGLSSPAHPPSPVTSRHLNETVPVIISSFAASFSVHRSLISSITTSTFPLSPPVSSVAHPSRFRSSARSQTSSPTTLESEAPTTAEIYKISENSKLASLLIHNKKSRLRRRLLVWQDEKSELAVTEWSVGKKKHYRIRERVKSRLPEAQHGTSLAIAADGSGLAHVFFLDARGTLSHVFETAVGVWKVMQIEKENGPIAVAEDSPLSAAWHRSRQGNTLLGVVYGNSQQVRLAMTDKPEGDDSWHVFDVAPLPDPAPGITDHLCFAVTGDWKSSTSGKDTEAEQMLVAALVEDGLHAWECSVGSWPPSASDSPCIRNNSTLQDADGRSVAFAPPPLQLAWIRLADIGDGSSRAAYDFSLIVLNENGQIDENRIGSDVGREPGQGVETEQSVRAISTTDEGILFAAARDDVYIFRLDAARWVWRAEGSLMPARDG